MIDLNKLENNFSEVLKLLVIIIIFIIAIFYLALKGNKKVIIDNWTEYRCNPFIMPFAGYFGKSSTENFQNCMWLMVKKYATFLLMPIKYITKLIHKILKGFGGSINDIRKMMLQIRVFFLSIVSNIMNRMWSLMGDMQYFIVKLRYTLKKLHAIMISVVYTNFTAIQTMRSTWDGPIGGFARFFCFHPDTEISLTDLSKKRIFELKLGDKTLGGGKIMGILKFKYTDDIQLYRYNDVIVSSYHIAYISKYNKWDRLYNLDSSDYSLVTNDLPEYLYSIITENHILLSNDTIFTDYIETSNPTIHKNTKKETINLLNKTKNMYHTHNINSDYISGFDPQTLIELKNGEKKEIKNVKIGDIQFDNSKILGIIIQNIDPVKTKIYKCNDIITTESQLIFYNDNWITIGNHPYSIQLTDYSNTILYNLVTETTNIYIENNIYRDYLEITDEKYNKKLDKIILNDLNIHK